MAKKHKLENQDSQLVDDPEGRLDLTLKNEADPCIHDYMPSRSFSG